MTTRKVGILFVCIAIGVVSADTNTDLVVKFVKDKLLASEKEKECDLISEMKRLKDADLVESRRSRGPTEGPHNPLSFFLAWSPVEAELKATAKRQENLVKVILPLTDEQQAEVNQYVEDFMRYRRSNSGDQKAPDSPKGIAHLYRIELCDLENPTVDTLLGIGSEEPVTLDWTVDEPETDLTNEEAGATLKAVNEATMHFLSVADTTAKVMKNVEDENPTRVGISMRRCFMRTGKPKSYEGMGLVAVLVFIQ